jgi:hypothetical protein
MRHEERTKSMLNRIFRRPREEHLPLSPHIRKDIGLPLLVSPHAAFLTGLSLGERR